MIAYTYSPYTYEFMGTSIADLDPMQNGVYLLPAHSTFVECPEYDRETQVGYFDTETQIWKIQDIESEPEVAKITQEQVDFLKKELEEVTRSRSLVLQKLGLTDIEADILLVKLPTEDQIQELLGQDLPEQGIPSLKHPKM